MPEAESEGPHLDQGQQPGTRGWALLLVIGSAIGLVASIILTVDRYKVLANPQVSLACDISPFVACGPAMTSRAGALFGFPNPLLGIAGFALVIATGVALLAGARLARWYLACLEVGCLLAVVFITWLQTQSLYVIGALCIYCMIVWTVTIPIFVVTTAHTLGAGVFGDGLRRVGAAIGNWQIAIIAIWYLVILTAIVLRFYHEFALYWFGVSV